MSAGLVMVFDMCDKQPCAGGSSAAPCPPDGFYKFNTQARPTLRPLKDGAQHLAALIRVRDEEILQLSEREDAFAVVASKRNLS